MQKIYKSVLLFVVLVFTLPVSVQASEKVYRVSFKGINAGKAKFSIQENGMNYQATLKLYPNFLASVAGVGNWVDSSKGWIVNGHFEPKVYQRTDGKKTLLSVKFSGKKVKVANKDGKRTININVLAQDPMSQIAQIQSDLKRNQLAKKYYLVTDKNQRLFTSQLVKMKNKSKVILTQANGGKRQLVLWFNQQFQLTRMKKIKRGKVDFDMVEK